ncbi:MAG TPA: biotin transporter BioY [Bacillota bacterium]|nr:biotin transporter BioY [Bacillota bacterium]HOH09504.1 biotin transporter BioY [Bacillota bacterium]HOS49970.1 biotin transporter BioY [Bacillota bacterium]HPI01669.1 biotin transporter BioY [Bacillota bacterium]HPM64484.1 biotin transporter BioY [Bacillota bacterium]
MELKTRTLTIVALFTALMIAGAYISIPIADLVPLTFQPFVSILAGSIIGPRLGFLAVFSYVVIGLAGVPVFSGFTGGFAKVLSPSFGFILGFLAAALVTGMVTGKDRPTFARVLAADMAGIFAIYLIGVPYMHFILRAVSGKDWTFWATTIGMVPFLVKDLALAAIASTIAVRLIPVARKATRMQ